MGCSVHTHCGVDSHNELHWLMSKHVVQVSCTVSQAVYSSILLQHHSTVYSRQQRHVGRWRSSLHQYGSQSGLLNTFILFRHFFSVRLLLLLLLLLYDDRYKCALCVCNDGLMIFTSYQNSTAVGIYCIAFAFKIYCKYVKGKFCC